MYNNRQSAADGLSNEQLQGFDYKLISSETIQKWSKLQEKLKSEAIDIKEISHTHLGKYDKGLMSIEDIVRTYRKL